MAELDNDDNVDLEALQAQIDLSLSHTKNLVSSWLKPAYGSNSSSRKGDQDKEIEELLRRPPRLGVGAPVPASTGALAVEGVKLKSKLTGKKRQREAEEADPSTAARDSEDEGESRGRAIQKKPKLDPFASTHGKKKKNHAEKVTSVASVQEEHTHLLKPVPSTPKKQVQAVGSPSELQPSGNKNKNKKHKTEGTDNVYTVNTSPLKHPSPTDCPHQESQSEVRTTATPIVTGAGPVSPSPKKQKETTFPGSESILNLNGPPSSNAEDTPSPKKKRNRQKKKKKKSGKAPNTKTEQDMES
ncbi:hypothetical protein BXZ70DRAFT_412379 [Cristinia sonorae]|uniref:Uncharacterized protein n=1 Tax=Cristinia sonorae TaxID=1940300 RepID=A0A8K0UXE7_9AGAR|nr:hypothetical protein BXZ70DRAFT_412379 [Cristinia sonorae]